MPLLFIIALQAIGDWFSFSSCVDYTINNELAIALLALVLFRFIYIYI